MLPVGGEGCKKGLGWMIDTGMDGYVDRSIRFLSCISSKKRISFDPLSFFPYLCSTFFRGLSRHYIYRHLTAILIPHKLLTVFLGIFLSILWNILNAQDDKMEINKLKKESGLTDAQFWAAAGWLAKEGKLIYSSEKKGRKNIESYQLVK